MCLFFSKNTEATCKPSSFHCLGPSVVPDMANDLLEISQDVKPTVSLQLEDLPSGEILHSFSFHLPILCWLGAWGQECLGGQPRQGHSN